MAAHGVKVQSQLVILITMLTFLKEHLGTMVSLKK